MEMLDIVAFFRTALHPLGCAAVHRFSGGKDNDSYPSLGRMLCEEAAVMVALAQILSYLKLMGAAQWRLPHPAMFPIILFAVRWGPSPA